jgi:hypothetical protein
MVMTKKKKKQTMKNYYSPQMHHQRQNLWHSSRNSMTRLDPLPPSTHTSMLAPYSESNHYIQKTPCSTLFQTVGTPLRTCPSSPHTKHSLALAQALAQQKEPLGM